MKKLFVFTLTAFFLFSGCSKAEKAQVTPPAETKKAEPKKELTTTTNPDKLAKWPADYPVSGDSVAVIVVEQEGTGELGTLVVEFYPDKAPNHVRNFKYLANNGYYNGVPFHRVIKGFMIQGGDPTGTGMSGPGWTVNAEFNDRPHKKGILSMARTNDPNSAGSQFFICHDNASHLDGQYTVFGNTIKGLDVVDKIANTPCGGPQQSTPLKKVTMKSVKIVPRSQAGL
jgi:peptidyl-prolyl cis-trans isomerase B (cyclophilin B)